MKLGVIKKVTLLSISGIVLLGVLSGMYFIHHESRVLNQALDERAAVLLNSLSTNCVYPLLIRDRQALGRLITGVLDLKDVILCEIKDADGNLLYGAGVQEGLHFREYSVPVVLHRSFGNGEELILGVSREREEQIGDVRIVLSLTELHRRIRNGTEAIAGFSLAIIAMMSMITSLLLKLILSRPIAGLVSGTERISRGDLDYQVPIRRNDEIGWLATAFNKMTQDLKKITVSKDYVDNILGSMSDALLVMSPQGTIQTVNAAICGLLGYEQGELVGAAVESVFAERSESTRQTLMDHGNISNEEKTFQTKDGQQIPVLFSASAMRDADGSIRGFVCAAKDIREQKRSEEQIKASLKEKEVLLKEIHHRVKNNLQIISSLLYLQSQQVQDQKTLEALRDSQNRVKSMALIHEKLYRSKDLARVDFNEYVRNLIGFLSTSYLIQAQTVSVKTNISDVSLDINIAIPCGLIINELVSNSLKHAFADGRRGEIRVDLYSDNGQEKGPLNLEISDNGVGLPEHIDFRQTESLGLQLVNTLVKQLDGTIELQKGGGTRFLIRFQLSK